MSTQGGAGVTIERLLRPTSSMRSTYGIVAVWIVLFVGTSLHSPHFFAWSTIVAIAFSMAFVGTLAVGQAVVMKCSELDLSVSVTAAASALIMATLLSDGLPFALALMVVVLFGAAIGVGNGVLVAKVGMPSIVSTLGTLFVIGGVTRLQADFVLVPRESFVREVIGSQVLKLPVAFWVMLLLMVIAAVGIEHARSGRHLSAVGGNSVAAAARGINVDRVRISAFVISGAVAGIAGIVLASQGDVVEANLATGTEFRVVSALLLGGFSLEGGHGRVEGLLASLWLLSTIPTALVTLGVSSNWQGVIEGLILATALALDGRRRARHG